MAYQQISGSGMWIGNSVFLYGLVSAGAFISDVIDASAEKYAYVGRVWFPTRTGTKDIRRVGFRFGTVVKAGGSALTVSLQDPSTTAGPPGRPDETQDQTVAIANANAAFASNSWIRTDAFSADRTVTFGDDLAVVVEYNGAGRLGSDSVRLTSFSTSQVQRLLSNPVLKTGGNWNVTNVAAPNLVLEMSDGTFGTLEGGLPIKAINTHSFHSGSAADEYAMPFSFPFPCKIDGMRFVVATDVAGCNFDAILYEGTTVRRTVSIDGNRASATIGTIFEVPFEEYTLDANSTYYVAVKPTTGNPLSVYSVDVDDANHLTTYPGGTTWTYTNRVDAGSWAAVTSTRQLIADVRVSSVQDGVGGAGGGGIISRSLIAGGS